MNLPMIFVIVVGFMHSQGDSLLDWEICLLHENRILLMEPANDQNILFKKHYSLDVIESLETAVVRKKWE